MKEAFQGDNLNPSPKFKKKRYFIHLLICNFNIRSMPTTKILLLDYDKTISPAPSTALEEMDERITQFICNRFRLSMEDSNHLRLEYNQKFGSTLGGLLHYYHMDPHEYFDFIHQIPQEALPSPNPKLQSWFNSLACPVYIFTNARMDWVKMGLDSMGFKEPPIEKIFDLEFLDWEGKPNPSAYQKVEDFLQKQHSLPLDIHFADDHPQNLKSAKARNWTTTWISPLDEDTHQVMCEFSIDTHFPSLSEIPLKP